MATSTINPTSIDILQDKANLLRIHSLRSTAKAGSGHPTSCASCAEIMSVLFYSVMEYDPKNPADPANDSFILSKGHAAPILYAAWAEADAFPVEKLLELRTFGSDLEGHPTPRLPFVGAATGSLGQGLSVGVGMAISEKLLQGSGRRIYVVLGDGESAEGSVWEAAHAAGYYKLDNLCATIDVNRLGQSQPTMDQHDMEGYRQRWSAFGWNAIVVDGHDISALLKAYEEAGQTKDRPTMVLAKTLKGKGIVGAENKSGQHGKAMENSDEAVQALEKELNGNGGNWKPQKPAQKAAGRKPDSWQDFPKAPYSDGKDVATRKAFADALAAIGKVSERIVTLDGDVKNSTYTEEFEKEFPKRFFQMYIAEQNMVGSAMGLAAKGEIPFAATFACFLSRAYDFLRMAAISSSNIKLVGTHAGISIGEDGPSQMGLEDLAMTCAQPNYTVLYPSDGVSAWYAIRMAAEHNGPCYIRTSRPKTPILYKQDETFSLGKCKVLRKSDKDQVTVVGAGVTVFEALEAHEKLASEGIHIRVVDLFSVKPIDKETLVNSVRETGKRVLIVEDHYAHGGIGDAVLAALADEEVKARKLAVREIARSGTPEELLDRYGISAKHIVDGIRSLIG